MSSDKENMEMELLGKYLAGEASPEEAMEVHDWLADPANKQRFDELSRLWAQLPGSRNLQTPQQAPAWLALKQKIVARKRPLLKRLLLNPYAAAACVIGVALIIFWQMQGDKCTDTKGIACRYISKAAYGSVVTDTMPDGSVVVINKNSSIMYSKQFNISEREVTLEGESFFNVRPDKLKPFVIVMGELKIEVVGTSFNVRKLNENSRIEVQVRTGIVKMRAPQKEMMVKAGQTGMYEVDSRHLSLRDTVDINSLGYATRSFSFNDLPLDEVCRYLGNAFGVNIQAGGEKLASCRLTAQFENKSLEYILDIINATLNTTHTRQGNRILIDGQGCN